MASDTAAIENFQEYLRIRSVQPNPDYNGTTAFLKKMADQLDLTYTVQEFVEKKPVLVMTWLGTDPSLPSVLLNSHTDVVPVFPECWKHDPFGAIIDDNGDIYARGTQDMKSVGIQYIEAIRRLKADGFKPLRTIHLSFVPDEEIGGEDGMQVLVKTSFFKSLNIGFALDEGLANPTEEFMVYYGERSQWWVQICCNGHPGHGSLFIEDNAGEKLRQVLNSFLNFRDLEEKRWKSGNLTLGDVTTVNLTKIQGGLQTNVIPSDFRATFDIRIPPFVDLVEFENRIKQWCEQAGPNVVYSFEKKVTFQGLTSIGADNPWWLAFKDVFDELKLSMKLQIFPAGTDSRFLRMIGLPALGFSPMNHTPVLLHDHNEFLNSRIYLRGIEIYAALIRRISGLQPV